MGIDPIVIAKVAFVLALAAVIFVLCCLLATNEDDPAKFPRVHDESPNKSGPDWSGPSRKI